MTLTDRLRKFTGELEQLEKNAPTSEDWGISSSLKDWKAQGARIKAQQLADPDNQTDPDDRAVMAAINEADAAIERAIVAQSKDGRRDVEKAQPSPAQVHSDAPLGDDEDEFKKAELTAQARKDLNDSDFALPGRKYPIHDESHARNALARVAQFGTPEEKAKVRAAVKRKFPSIEVTKAEDFEITVDLIKADEQRLVYGVVLTPGVRDSQGDIATAAEIQKAAHAFMADHRLIDVQHSDVYKNADGQPIATPVESFCAPADMTLGGQKVLKGAWVLGMRINDEPTWREVKAGKRSGLSMAGTGVRLPD